MFAINRTNCSRIQCQTPNRYVGHNENIFCTESPIWFSAGGRSKTCPINTKYNKLKIALRYCSQVMFAGVGKVAKLIMIESRLIPFIKPYFLWPKPCKVFTLWKHCENVLWLWLNVTMVWKMLTVQALKENRMFDFRSSHSSEKT